MYYHKDGSIIQSDLNLDLPKATKEEWDAKNAPTYSEKRQNEYPSLSEQLDMIYWDKVNGTNLWQAKIAEIKNKYPKC